MTVQHFHTEGGAVYREIRILETGIGQRKSELFRRNFELRQDVLNGTASTGVYLGIGAECPVEVCSETRVSPGVSCRCRTYSTCCARNLLQDFDPQQPHQVLKIMHGHQMQVGGVIPFVRQNFGNRRSTLFEYLQADAPVPKIGDDNQCFFGDTHHLFQQLLGSPSSRSA